jgi:hypothetical protein
MDDLDRYIDKRKALVLRKILIKGMNSFKLGFF